MFELDEYGYMVPAFLSEDLDDSTWMFAFTYVTEIALSVFDDHCDCTECYYYTYQEGEAGDDPF